MTLAILDADLRRLRLESGAADEILRLVSEHPRAVCGVDAPISHSHGLLSDPAYRSRLGLKPGSSYSGFRICEYELRRRGIPIYKTPVDRSTAATWMKESWRLYDRLREIGFVAYPQAGARRMFETYPHAVFTMLIKKRPYRKNTLEGRLQRQLILLEEGVDVPDAMDALEEMTRHRILTGELVLRGLYTDDELDALAAAYAAFALDREPHNVSAIGDPTEGQILVPVPVHELRELYS